jgi:hypothetical protein
MNKILIVAIAITLLATLFTSCENNKIQQRTGTIQESNIKVSWGVETAIRVLEIDSCEYLVATKNNAISIIHKQNCKFCK